MEKCISLNFTRRNGKQNFKTKVSLEKLDLPIHSVLRMFIMSFAAFFLPSVRAYCAHAIASVLEWDCFLKTRNRPQLLVSTPRPIRFLIHVRLPHMETNYSNQSRFYEITLSSYREIMLTLFFLFFPRHLTSSIMFFVCTCTC